MLVLSRKKNQSIIIDHDITIEVVEIRGDNVRLGITAPRHISVNRKEIEEAILRNAEQELVAESDVAVSGPKRTSGDLLRELIRENKELYEAAKDLNNCLCGAAGPRVIEETRGPLADVLARINSGTARYDRLAIEVSRVLAKAKQMSDDPEVPA